MAISFEPAYTVKTGTHPERFVPDRQVFWGFNLAQKQFF
jgi:hypothetical protein